MNNPPANWIDAANALADVLEAENAALRAADFAAAAALLPAKRAAIERSESFVPAGPQSIVSDTFRRLDRLATENRGLLDHGIYIQSQVLGIIAAAARIAFGFGYGSSGEATVKGHAFTLSAKA